MGIVRDRVRYRPAGRCCECRRRPIEANLHDSTAGCWHRQCRRRVVCCVGVDPGRSGRLGDRGVRWCRTVETSGDNSHLPHRCGRVRRRQRCRRGATRAARGGCPLEVGTRTGRCRSTRFFHAPTTGPAHSGAAYARARGAQPTSKASPRPPRPGARAAVDRSPRGDCCRRVQVPSAEHRRCALGIDRPDDRVRTRDACPDRHLVAVEARALQAAHRTVDDADVGLHPDDCGQRALLRVSVARTCACRRTDHHRNRGTTRLERGHVDDDRSSPARMGRG